MSERMRYWQRRVAQFESSGLSRMGFCRRHRLNYHTMTYWVKRLASLDGVASGDARPSFVEVSLPAVAAVAAPATYEVLLGNDRSIRLGPAFDEETVGRLVRTLESC